LPFNETQLGLKKIATALEISEMIKEKSFNDLAKKLNKFHVSNSLDFFIRNDQGAQVSSHIRFVMFQFLWTSNAYLVGIVDIFE